MDSGPAARRAGDGRPRGRPRSLDAERLATARRLYAGGAHSVTEIAERLGVSRATLYRHLDRA
jgi:DNA invertase Pin-like site-specific DNA recombinase